MDLAAATLKSVVGQEGIPISVKSLSKAFSVTKLIIDSVTNSSSNHTTTNNNTTSFSSSSLQTSTISIQTADNLCTALSVMIQGNAQLNHTNSMIDIDNDVNNDKFDEIKASDLMISVLLNSHGKSTNNNFGYSTSSSSLTVLAGDHAAAKVSDSDLDLNEASTYSTVVLPPSLTDVSASNVITLQWHNSNPLSNSMGPALDVRVLKHESNPSVNSFSNRLLQIEKNQTSISICSYSTCLSTPTVVRMSIPLLSTSQTFSPWYWDSYRKSWSTEGVVVIRMSTVVIYPSTGKTELVLDNVGGYDYIGVGDDEDSGVSLLNMINRIQKLQNRVINEVSSSTGYYSDPKLIPKIHRIADVATTHFTVFSSREEPPPPDASQRDVEAGDASLLITTVNLTNWIPALVVMTIVISMGVIYGTSRKTERSLFYQVKKNRMRLASLIAFGRTDATISQLFWRRERKMERRSTKTDIKQHKNVLQIKLPPVIPVIGAPPSLSEINDEEDYDDDEEEFCQCSCRCFSVCQPTHSRKRVECIKLSRAMIHLYLERLREEHLVGSVIFARPESQVFFSRSQRIGVVATMIMVSLAFK